MSLAGCCIDRVSVNNINYADVMPLLTPSINALNEFRRISKKHAVFHGLLYNMRKIVIKAPDRKAPDMTLPVLPNGAPISRVSQFQYLDHCLTINLKDDVDVEWERRSWRCGTI